ncbi:MAG: TPM domain-containing protein [Kiloniellales bacterium]|nr:TPM domain-containing protein [Kiloniellales bacterium]
MEFIKDEDKARIARAIQEAESRTAGEIVTIIAREADDYPFLPLLWAAGTALLTPLPLVLLDLPLTALQIYEIQIVVFLGLGLLTRWQPIKMRLIPRALKRQRAGRLARAQFVEQGLHHTEGRSGIMIFVSVAERYVEIMADQGINDRVPPGSWDGIVRDFVAKVRAKQTAEAFLNAVERCGALLAEHFPAEPRNPDELPNHLVEL